MPRENTPIEIPEGWRSRTCRFCPTTLWFVPNGKGGTTPVAVDPESNDEWEPTNSSPGLGHNHFRDDCPGADEVRKPR